MEEDEATESADSLLREIARAPDRSPDPERIGRFRVTGRIGAGGMGIVYRAEDESLRRPVAIKVLPTDVQGDDERRKRLVREARAAAAVTHPNLAAIYEVGEADGRVYIAMELVEGESLRARLNAATFPVSDALAIATQIAKGLSRAHRAGIVHRDLKPENVMVSDDGHVKILDFGLAKIRAVEAENESAFAKGETVTHEGRVMGTPAYMAPEQARGLDVTAAADVFAFGVMLYEMIAGRRPFAGSTTAEIATIIDRGPPKPIADDAALDSLLGRCLAPAAIERPSDGAALVTALSALDPAARGRIPSKDDVAPEVNARAPHTAHATAQRQRRRPPLALTLSAVALACVGAWAVTRHSPTAAVAASSAPSSSPAPSVTTYTDLPVPLTHNARAAAEYAAALQALRDDSWDQARAHLATVVELDPALAPAHLRLSLTNWSLRDRPRAREEYSRALALRSQLDERDQLFADALEPVLLRAREDRRDAYERLRKIHDRWPGDIEILALLAVMAGDVPAEQLALADDGLKLDPKDGNLLESRGAALVDVGRNEEARAAFEKATVLSNTAADNFTWLAGLDATEGRCAEMERHARLYADRNLTPDENLLAAIVANGGSNDSLHEVLAQLVSRMPAPFDRFAEASCGARLAVARGDFSEARRLVKEAEALLARDPERSHSLGLRADLVSVLLVSAIETGSGDEVTRLAKHLVGEADELAGSVSDRTSLIWIRRLAAGTDASSIAAFEKDRDAAADAALARRELVPIEVWSMHYASAVMTPADGAIALAALPRFGPSSDQHRWFRVLMAGRALFIGGRRDEALPYLRRAVAACGRFWAPWFQVDAANELGELLASNGDHDGACAAYGKVISWWGTAKPRSVSADRARAARTSLQCKD